MAVNWDFVRTVEKGAVGAMLEMVVTESDLVTVRNLTGYAAWIAFSYPGSSPHVTRAAKVSDAANGIVLYATQGDEFPTAGTCRLQLTIATSDSGIGTGRGFFEVPLPEVRREVMEVPA